MVALNAAAALVVAGMSKSLPEALDNAREVLKSGAPARVLERYAQSSQRLRAPEAARS